MLISLDVSDCVEERKLVGILAGFLYMISRRIRESLGALDVHQSSKPFPLTQSFYTFQSLPRIAGYIVQIAYRHAKHFCLRYSLARRPGRCTCSRRQQH